jgi:hypothetical protein
MEGLNEAISVIITAAVAAVIRYFEKRKIQRDQNASEHFRK